MTDLNKTILQKASGETRIKPDEQRKFLETFEERVVGSCSVADASSSIFRKHFKEILARVRGKYSPITVKISPALDSGAQIFYLKTAKEMNCEATIVSDSCKHSPFGLIVHSDHPVQVNERELKKHFASLLDPQEKETIKQKKPSFWDKLFQ